MFRNWQKKQCVLTDNGSLKDFKLCILNNDFIYKDKVYFSEREFLRFVFKKFVKENVCFGEIEMEYVVCAIICM